MSTESLPSPVPFDELLTHHYQADPSIASHRAYAYHPEEGYTGYYQTRPSEAVGMSYNPEMCLAPDPVSDAFGRMAAFSLGDFYDRGGPRPRPSMEYLKGLVGGELEDYRYAVDVAAMGTDRVLDLGTGSGVFSVSLMNTVPIGQRYIQIDTVDISAPALLTADSNFKRAAANLESVPDIRLRLADWLDGAEGRYHLVYFNPPYLSEDHEIRSAEQAMAPYDAIRVRDPWQEYAKVLPLLPELLLPTGFAMIRLPREPDDAMYAKLSELCSDLSEPTRWSFVEVKAGETERPGYGMLLANSHLPNGFSSYDYFNNYLGGAYKPYAKPSYTTSLYHDGFCRINVFKKGWMRHGMGLVEAGADAEVVSVIRSTTAAY